MLMGKKYDTPLEILVCHMTNSYETPCSLPGSFKHSTPCLPVGTEVTQGRLTSAAETIGMS